jgi:cell division protein DivIC
MFNKVKIFFESYLKPLKNKYLLTTVFFLVWILFFDHNNLIDRAQLIHDVNQLEGDRDYYIERIGIDSARLIELRSSPENLEKFAREQYLMKKDNEDIFVIIEE